MRFPNITSLFILLILFVLAEHLSGQSEDGQNEPEGPPVEENQALPQNSPNSEPLVPAEEAQNFLLNTKIGNTDAQIIAQGYWRMKFGLGGRFTTQDGGTSFRGISEGFSFSQEPDLNLSLLLDERWFVETTFLNNFDNNVYRLGYKGKEGDFVQEISAGNSGINMNPYANVSPAKPLTNTPGFLAHFETAKSRHELLIRYDSSSIARKTFRGNYEVKTSLISPGDYVRGQYFILPDENIKNPIIYVEDSTGGIKGTDTAGRSRFYRQLKPSEYFVNLNQGTLSTAKASEKTLLIYYESPKGPVGDDTAPADQRGGRNFILPADIALHPNLSDWDADNKSLLPFDWSESNAYDPQGRSYGNTLAVDIESRRALILFHPNIFTPFETLNHYSSPQEIPEEKWRSEVLLKRKGESVPINNNLLTFETSREQEDITVLNSANARYPANRYPFAGEIPNIYGPASDNNPDTIPTEMLLVVHSASRGFQLGSGIIPDSVQITINGNPVNNFTSNENGSLEFQRFIFPDDWIEVSFRKEGGSLSRGNLRIYQGNLFQFTPTFKWELTEGFQWYFSPDKYSTDFGENTGEIRVASLLEWKSDRAETTLTLDSNFRNNDTIGTLRLYGMDSGGLELSFFTDSTVRSPETILFPLLPASSRHNIKRYNYSSSDGLGRSILNNFLWPGARDSDGFGPGLASGGTEKSGRVVDIRFNLTTPGWGAGDILLDKKRSLDFSAYSSLSLPVRFIREDGSPPSRVILQIGEIGEREDYQSDGFIDPPDEDSSISVNLGTAEWSTGNLSQAWESNKWHTVRIPLSPRMRASLKRSRAMRLIVENSSTEAVSGRLIVGEPRLSGLSFISETLDQNGKAIQSENVANDEITDNSLKNAFPETASIFHPNGGNNRLLRTRWGDKVVGAQNLEQTHYWQIKSWFSAVPIQAYEKLVFYLKDEEGAGPLSASITDGNGKGLHLSWTPVKGSWDKITIDIPRKKAYSANGSSIHFLDIDQEDIQLTNFTLKGTDRDSQTTSSSRSGSILLDEIHFSTPAISFQGIAKLDFSWEYQEDVYNWNNIPILGNIKIKGRGSFAGETILSGLEVTAEDSPENNSSQVLSMSKTYRGNNTNFNSSLEASADTLGMKLQGRWRGSWTGTRTAYGASHSIRIPARTETFWLSDSYAWDNQSSSFERENELQLNLDNLSLLFLTTAKLNDRTLLQQWKGETDWKVANWKGRLSANYSRKTPNVTINAGEYFDSWINGYSYLVPVGASPSSRDARHSLHNTLEWENLSIVWDLQLNISQTNFSALKQINQWKSTLEFPLNFESWELTPFYSRDWREERGIETEDYNSFDDAWRGFIDSATAQHPLTHYVPIAEIFGDGSTFNNISKDSPLSTYKAAAGVNWSRKTEGELLEIILPRKVGISTERQYKKKSDTVGWENIWKADIGFNLRNMFGKFGYYSVTEIYNHEEIYSDFSFTFEDTNGYSFPDITSLGWKILGDFQGNSEGIFKFENEFVWSWESRKTTQETTLSLNWREPARDSLTAPLVRSALAVQNYVAHKESVIMEGLYVWPESSTESSEERFLFSLRHESGIIFPDWGHVKASLALGMGHKDKEFSSVWETTVELELHF